MSRLGTPCRRWRPARHLSRPNPAALPHAPTGVRPPPDIQSRVRPRPGLRARSGVVPVGAFVENSENNVIPNLSFRGIKFPEKLESYIHFVPGPSANAVLSKDPRGTWTVRYDELLGRAMVRSLVWLGYTFYFDSRTLNFGGMYVGTGVRNNDLIFML